MNLLPKVQRGRVSELIAGAATTVFAVFSATSLIWTEETVQGPSAKAATKTLMYLSFGDAAGFGIVFLVSLFYTGSHPEGESGEVTRRKAVVDVWLEYVFLISAVVSSVAIGGVFPKMSVIDVYQSSQRETLLDQNRVSVWFVGVWGVIWALMRAYTVSERRIALVLKPEDKIPLPHADGTVLGVPVDQSGPSIQKKLTL